MFRMPTTQATQARPATPPSPPSLAAPPGRLFAREHLPVVAGTVALVTLGAFENRAVMTILPTVTRDLDGWALFGASTGASLVTFTIAMAWAGGWTDRRGPSAGAPSRSAGLRHRAGRLRPCPHDGRLRRRAGVVRGGRGPRQHGAGGARRSSPARRTARQGLRVVRGGVDPAVTARPERGGRARRARRVAGGLRRAARHRASRAPPGATRTPHHSPWRQR